MLPPKPSHNEVCSMCDNIKTVLMSDILAVNIKLYVYVSICVAHRS